MHAIPIPTFRADNWRGEGYSLMHLIGVCSGPQRTITGQVINCNPPTAGWSGIRNCGRLSQEAAETAADLLNAGDITLRGNAEVGECLHGDQVIGHYIDTHERQPGDDFIAARTVRASVAGEIEWFHTVDTARNFLVARAALALADRLIAAS